MKALIIVDMQNDFIEGSLGTPHAKKIVEPVAQLINNSKYEKIIFTRDTHTEDYLNTSEGKKLPVKHCIKGTSGWNISEMLNVENSEIINKSTFGYTGWMGKFDEFSNIDIAGLCTDICVISNAVIIKALYPEKEISIIEKCTAGTTPENKLSALNVAKSCQINVI